MSENWRKAMRERITSLPGEREGKIPSSLESASSLPFAATKYWLGLAGEDYRNCRREGRGIPLDPILAQALPSGPELETLPRESEDPLWERTHSPAPRLVHQYRSRILLRTSGECPVFCRYCFRRSLLRKERGFISAPEQEEVSRYLLAHPEVREGRGSGGDPLTASTSKLEALFKRLRAGREGILIRLCTRAPVTLPERVDEELVTMLARFKPMRLVIHINHPAEISPLFAGRIEALLSAGLPVRSQTVLLRGINDSGYPRRALRFSCQGRRRSLLLISGRPGCRHLAFSRCALAGPRHLRRTEEKAVGAGTPPVRGGRAGRRRKAVSAGKRRRAGRGILAAQKPGRIPSPLS